MTSYWSVFPKILMISAEPFELLRGNKDNLWFSLRVFLLVALIASLPGLATIPGEVEQITLAERVDGLARRLEKAIPMLPWIFSDLLEELVESVNQVVERIQAVEPPLGVRPSRLLRLLGAWLEQILNWLATWLVLALFTWLIARLLGGESGLRNHMSLSLLAVVPLGLLFVPDLLVGYLAPSLMLSYLVWAFRIALWVWSAAILVRAISIAHRFPLDHAVAVLILTGFLSLLLSVLPLALVALILFALF